MPRPNDTTLAKKFLAELPIDGSAIGNGYLRESLGWGLGTYLRVKEQLLDDGRIRKAMGRGGAVARVKNQRKRSNRQAIRASTRSSAKSRVFVTHGHDDGLRNQVVELLEKVDLDPVVLQDKPNAGKTLIEKFEAHSNVNVAVVIFTADDVGGKAGEEAKPRARQNVMLELGYFIGKLSRPKVVLLHDGKAEVPSDLQGLATVQCSQNWKLSLLRELRTTGLPISGTIDALLE